MTAEVIELESKRPKLQGVVGTTIYSGFIQGLLQDNNFKLSGANWYGTISKLGEADKLLQDPYAYGAYCALTHPILKGFWTIPPVADPQPIDLEVAAFGRKVFFDILPWQQFLGRVVKFVSHGFSMFEPAEKVIEISKDEFPNHPGNGMAIVYSDLVERPQYTLWQTFQQQDDSTKLDYLTQNTAGSDVEPAGIHRIDSDNLLRFTWDQRGANFVGRAPMRAAWAPWFRKTVYETIQAIHFERTGCGIPCMELPKGTDQAIAARGVDMLGNIRSSETAYMLLESGMKFWIEVAKGGVVDLLHAIKQNSLDILFSQNCGFMGLGSGTGAKGGSFALASEQRGQFSLSVEAFAKFIADIINFGMDGWALIERLIRKNYGPKVKIPRIECRDLPTRDIVEIIKALPQLIQARIITADAVLEDFGRKVFQLPPHDPATARMPAMAIPPTAEAEQVQIEEEARDEGDGDASADDQPDPAKSPAVEQPDESQEDPKK